MNSPPPTVDKSGKSIQAMFGQIARRYDLLNHLLSLGIDRYWRRKTTRLVPPRGDDPILDLCTGTGDLAFAYGRATKNRLPIVGADFCRPMLARGQEKNRRAGTESSLQFVEADGLNLPFVDDRFQIVSVAFGLRNMADTLGGIREMVRVCRPGGRVAILEFSLPEGRVIGPLYKWYFRFILPKVGQAVAKNRLSAYNYLPKSVVEFPQGESMLRLMHDAGLHQVRQHRFTFGVASLYVGEK